MNLDEILTNSLDSGTVGQISQSLGVDQSTTNNAIQTALPILLAALARNSSTPDGASSLLGALDRDHDGSILDDVSGFITNHDASDGRGILEHLFGSRVDSIQDGVSRSSGLDSSTTAQLLMMLAPIVMGALGRKKQEGAIDQSNLPEVLTGATEQIAGDTGTLGLLSQLLDSNKDGSAVDDVMRMASGLFRK